MNWEMENGLRRDLWGEDEVTELLWDGKPHALRDGNSAGAPGAGWRRKGFLGLRALCRRENVLSFLQK